MADISGSLITFDEAEEVIKAQDNLVSRFRTPLLAVIVVLLVGVITLLVMILLSLRGTQTNLPSVLPFLSSSNTPTTLQSPTE